MFSRKWLAVGLWLVCMVGALAAIIILGPARNQETRAPRTASPDEPSDELHAPAGSTGESSASGDRTDARDAKSKKIMDPAVAGLFYPAAATELADMIDGLLSSASPPTVKDLRALVCPHAGYRYSGLTAAHGYKLLEGRKFDTAIILAPSHYARFNGVSLPDADVWRTPLGLVPISSLRDTLAGSSPFSVLPPSRVQRPGWWRESPLGAPSAGEDTPHTWEHSDEVQVPFLQRTLRDFEVLPAIFGQVDPAAAALALEAVLDDRTIVIASSDLSHYHPYDDAKKLDRETIEAILALDVGKMAQREACGKRPILALMYLAKRNGWRPQLLDLRNSGDTAGRKNSVVGYAAIAFSGPAPSATIEFPKHEVTKMGTFNEEERQFMLALARKTLLSVTLDNTLPEIDPEDVPESLEAARGCFVTLTKNGRLRGCIGHIFAQEALYKAIIDNAQSAARRDYRFSPVEPEELDDIRIEVSVLSEPKPLEFDSPEDLLSKLQPHRDGVVLKTRWHRATYLPQVWEQLPDKEAFLSHLSSKAGAPADAWRQPGIEVLIYHAEAFEEAEH